MGYAARSHPLPMPQQQLLHQQHVPQYVGERFDNSMIAFSDRNPHVYNQQPAIYTQSPAMNDPAHGYTNVQFKPQQATSSSTWAYNAYTDKGKGSLPYGYDHITPTYPHYDGHHRVSEQIGALHLEPASSTWVGEGPLSSPSHFRGEEHNEEEALQQPEGNEDSDEDDLESSPGQPEVAMRQDNRIEFQIWWNNLPKDERTNIFRNYLKASLPPGASQQPYKDIQALVNKLTKRLKRKGTKTIANELNSNNREKHFAAAELLNTKATGRGVATQLLDKLEKVWNKRRDLASMDLCRLRKAHPGANGELLSALTTNDEEEFERLLRKYWPRRRNQCDGKFGPD